MRLPLPLLLTALVGASCANAPAPDAESQARRQCFWPSEVSGFSAAGPKTALVNLGARETWEITLSPGCPAVDWAMRIGIRTRGGGRICTGRDAELVVPNASGSGARTCLVRSVRKLSPAETATARGRKPPER
jgi:hypothetical protein